MRVLEMAAKARKASYALANTDIKMRNAALLALIAALEENKEEIFSANRTDVSKAKAEKLPSPLLKRLTFDEKKLEDIQAGLQALIALSDPLHQTLLSREMTPGLKLFKVTCPIGVLGIIFESRPDALIQIAALALKSGNAVLLKGGSEAKHTNRALFGVLLQATDRAGLPHEWAALLETREDVGEMLKAQEDIDLLIPRGSNAFVKYIMENTAIPVMGHAEGLCHTYIDQYADIDMAVRVTADAKTQAYAVCNATETLLVHREIADRLLPKLAAELERKKVELRGDARVQSLIACKRAEEADWATEYLSAVLSIKMVDTLDEAIAHINRYGSHHTDAIITNSGDSAKRFTSLVDSAGVYVNCSTRFADGFRYGFGAEVGIATGKLHARGPVGLEGLCTYKYFLLGEGQTVEDTVTGKLEFTHRDLDERCPL